MTEPEITETIETPQANGENAVGGAGTAVALPREQEAGSPLRTAGQFAKDHPYIVIAGGLAAGAIAASFLPKGTARKFARRAVTLAEAASAASLLLGKTAVEKANTAGHELRDYGSTAADQIGRLGGVTASRVHDVLGNAGAMASDAGHMIAEKASELRARVKR